MNLNHKPPPTLLNLASARQHQGTWPTTRRGAGAGWTNNQTRVRFLNRRQKGRPRAIFTEHMRWRAWRGCLHSLRGARSIPHRWPRLHFNATSPGRRLRLRTFVAKASKSRVARPARASPRGEPTDRPQSKCAGELGVVIFAANAEHAPSHAVGRGSTSTQPCQVGGCGIEYSWL